MRSFEQRVQLKVALPKACLVIDLAIFSMPGTAGEAVTFGPVKVNQAFVEPHFQPPFPANFAEDHSELTGDLVIYYCEAETQRCA